MPHKHFCKRWAFDVATWKPTRAEMARAIAVVQPEERERLMRFHFIDDFLTSLVGRLLMRKYVSLCTGVQYDLVRFARDARGKPYWLRDQAPNAPQLSFNVSHQGDFIVLAGVHAATDADPPPFGVGVDVMKLEYSGGKPLDEFFRIMHKKFSTTEWLYIKRPQHSTESDRLKAFMRHWCLKEAYVKELGVGITIDLQQISFSVDPHQQLEPDSPILSNASLHCQGRPMPGWHFEEHLLQPQYCASVAFRNCRPALQPFELLRIDDLLPPACSGNAEAVADYCDRVFRKERKRC